MPQKIQDSISTLLMAVLVVCLVSGCQLFRPPDPIRDANVKSFDRLVSVFQRVLHVDRAKITLASKLATLGVDDSDAIVLKKALENEFAVEFPEKLFLPNTHVNDMVSYIALRVYKVDNSGTLVNDSGPVSPDYFEKLEEEKKEQQKNIDEGKVIPSETPPPPAPDAESSPDSTTSSNSSNQIPTAPPAKKGAGK